MRTTIFIDTNTEANYFEKKGVVYNCKFKKNKASKAAKKAVMDWSERQRHFFTTL